MAQAKLRPKKKKKPNGASTQSLLRRNLKLWSSGSQWSLLASGQPLQGVLAASHHSGEPKPLHLNSPEAVCDVPALKIPPSLSSFYVADNYFSGRIFMLTLQAEVLRGEQHKNLATVITHLPKHILCQSTLSLKLPRRIHHVD